MALVILNPAFSQIRGRLGDVVFVPWRGLTYIRKYVPRNHSNSPKQSSKRNEFALAVKTWGQLSKMSKALWSRRAASLGKTGYHFYIGEALRRGTRKLPTPHLLRLGRSPGPLDHLALWSTLSHLLTPPASSKKLRTFIKARKQGRAASKASDQPPDAWASSGEAATSPILK